MELIDLLDVAIDCMIFNFFHASAAYTQLAKRKGCLQPSNWDAPVLSRLHARVQNLVVQDQLNAQSSANVLWSIAQLSDQFGTPHELVHSCFGEVYSRKGAWHETTIIVQLLVGLCKAQRLCT